MKCYLTIYTQMSIQVKLTFSSKKPTLNNNGGYDIYSAEEKLIKPNESVMANSGLILYIPEGYTGLIQSSELVASRSIETKNFANIHYQHRFNNINSELILYLRNSGLSEYIIKIGDVIGKLIIIESIILPILDVDEITAEEDEIIKPPQVANEFKKVYTWFKKTYIKDIYLIQDAYFNECLLNQIIEYRTTDTFKNAVNKNNIEANYAWSILPQSLKLKIKKEFENESEDDEAVMGSDDEAIKRADDPEEVEDMELIRTGERIYILEKMN